MNYKQAFPHFDGKLPAITGFVDDSWHNDDCPSMFNESKGLKLFINFTNPKLREFDDFKYVLCHCKDQRTGLILATNILADIHRTLKVTA